jgi:DNA primase
MNINNPQYIREYLMDNLGDNYKISSDGVEFICPSVFLEDDYKRHMSINLDTGLWQCFKTGKKGNFVALYSYLENISYFDALVRITTRNLEYVSFEEKEQNEEVKIFEFGFDSDDYVEIRYDYAGTDEEEVVKAWGYLNNRGLFDIDNPQRFRYYYAKSGRYAGRIIIPYEYDDSVFFFQARTITDQKPKYLIPENSSAAHILYPFDESEPYVVVCEGIMDAITLQIAGMNATCSTGANITKGQAEILKNFGGKIILAFDNDRAGFQGVVNFNRLRKDMRMDKFYWIFPPSGKDWNECPREELSKVHFKNLDTKFDELEIAARSLL